MFTFEECADGHKRLWNWLSENPDKHKSDWPEFEQEESGLYTYNGIRVRNQCFACCWTADIADGRYKFQDCTKCPITWRDNIDGHAYSADTADVCLCEIGSSEFKIWRFPSIFDSEVKRGAKEYLDIRSRYAKIIADKSFINKC